MFQWCCIEPIEFCSRLDFIPIFDELLRNGAGRKNGRKPIGNTLRIAIHSSHHNRADEFFRNNTCRLALLVLAIPFREKLCPQETSNSEQDAQKIEPMAKAEYRSI